ncbi:hypothetical protein TYRP_021746 [Tyrophagus putrescentiae]|nr:hypothetical protein TYRP_021746 [Tyrophagus putrescentiae]
MEWNEMESAVEVFEAVEYELKLAMRMVNGEVEVEGNEFEFETADPLLLPLLPPLNAQLQLQLVILQVLLKVQLIIIIGGADLGQQLRVAELLQLLQVAVGAGEVEGGPLRRDALLPVDRQQIFHVAEEDVEALAVDRHRVRLA